MMWIVKNPELATGLNLVKAKADIFVANADWQSFFNILFMVVGAGGIIIFGFVTSWVFGREYSDRTVKDILALPVSRNEIVISKFVAVTVWCLLLSGIIFLVGILSGLIVNLSGWSLRLLIFSLKTYFITTLMIILLSFVIGFIASVGKGYLSPLGFVIFMIMLAQFAGHLGWGTYFPWSIPVLYTGAAGAEQQAQLSYTSYIIVILTGISGFVGTMLWWQFSDY